MVNSMAISEEKYVTTKEQTENTPFKAWVYHSEWFALMTTLIVLFVWVHNESVHTNQRLDNHIEAINRRCDEANKRSDELHKEFYDLLKEMRK